jgi:hypothetical protein
MKGAASDAINRTFILEESVIEMSGIALFYSIYPIQLFPDNIVVYSHSSSLAERKKLYYKLGVDGINIFPRQGN